MTRTLAAGDLERDLLAEVGQGSWHPGNDARPWVRFSLTAHYRQALTFLSAGADDPFTIAAGRSQPSVGAAE